MSEIKDIIDLCIQFRNERRESWVAPFVERIQILTLSLQSAQSEVAAKNSELDKENVNLHRNIFQMEQYHREAVSALNTKHREEVAALNLKIAEFQSDSPPIVAITTRSIFADE